jgi:large subunit ribosomal protein L18
MLASIDRRAIRRRIRHRIRKKISGTAQCPRLAVFRSSKHMYAQAIDDETGKTLASASTLDADVKGRGSAAGNVEGAKAVGAVIAERLKAAGVDTVVFDRGGFLHHGRVKALADSAREAGLKF